MLEVGLEVRDLVDLSLNGGSILSARADDHGEVVATAVATTRVDATDAMVLVVADILHELSLLGHLLIVEEVSGFEGAFGVPAGEVRLCLVNVVAETLAIAHAVDPLFAERLSCVTDSLATERDVEDIRCHWSKLSLVLHESGDSSLLVPDEEVLASLSRSVDN